MKFYTFSNTLNSFLFMEYKFSWISLVQANHIIYCITNGMNKLIIINTKVLITQIYDTIADFGYPV
jgi:hypothetical protein